MSLDYWFMFPIAIVIATTAMASGVEGATFFTPLFILALRLSPEIAIGTGLITEVFGFASGVIAYARKGLIDYRFGRPRDSHGTARARGTAVRGCRTTRGSGAHGLGLLRPRDGRRSAGP